MPTSPGTFSSRNAFGLETLRRRTISKNKLPLGQLKPGCCPSAENGWQGKLSIKN